MAWRQIAYPPLTVVISPPGNRRGACIPPGQAVLVDALHQDIFWFLFVLDEVLLVGDHEVVHATGDGVFLVHDLHFERAKWRGGGRDNTQPRPGPLALWGGISYLLIESKSTKL